MYSASSKHSGLGEFSKVMQTRHVVYILKTAVATIMFVVFKF